jgi:F-type H+-transporting ATPase subunit c
MLLFLFTIKKTTVLLTTILLLYSMEIQAFKFLAVGILGIAFAGAAIGVGKVFASALEAISRNPSAESKITKYMFIGAGLAEAMGLFGLVLALLLMFG